MGGVAGLTGTGAKRAEEFRHRIGEAQRLSLSMGGTLKDVTDAIDGMADGMGRMVNPTSEVLKDIIATGKAFGITTAESAKMVTDFVKFGGTQREALKTMKGIADEARKTGINTAAYMKAVQGGLKMANGFGFKSGIEGLKTMAKQAAMLRSSIEGIGAKQLQSKILDPEGAIQTAAGFQMLGGAVGKLADPFQLMHMAQTDMAGLQAELVKSTKSSFAFNKETGKFDASTQDLYRLRQQAELTGANFDEMVEAGKEAAKLDFLSNAVDLSSLSEAQQGLVSSLAEIDKDGKVTVDIPGFEEGTADLTTLMKDQNFKDALDKYQTDEKKTAEQIALDQMNLSEKQLASVNNIEHAVVLGLSAEKQEKFYDDIASTNKSAQDVYEKGAKDVSPVSGKIAVGETALEAAGAEGAAATTKQGIDALKAALDTYNNNIPIPVRDAFLPAGGAPMVMSEGQLYKGIVGDSVAIGTGLDEALNQSSKLNEIMSSMASTKNSGSGNGGGNASVDGKIDININLTGAISGDKSGDIEKMFSDPRIQKQLMDTVLYKLDSYKRQQGVLS